MAFDLPPQAGIARDQAILEHVKSGDVEFQWGRVSNADKDNNRIDLAVFADAMKIGGVRVDVTAENQQQIADLLGCILMTAKIADLLWMQRNVTLPPLPMPITSSTEAMVKQSKRVDDAIVAAGSGVGIIQTVGKHWIIDQDVLQYPGKATNYGWHCTSKTWTGSYEPCASLAGNANCHVVQGRGWAHDPRHTDYSQICILVAKQCVVNGQPDDLTRVLTDKNLAHLVSHSGPMTVLRQPGVPELAPLARAPGKPGGSVMPVDWKQGGGERGTDWGGVGIAALGIGLTIAGFWAALKSAGPKGAREPFGIEQLVRTEQYKNKKIYVYREVDNDYRHPAPFAYVANVEGALFQAPTIARAIAMAKRDIDLDYDM